MSDTDKTSLLFRLKLQMSEIVGGMLEHIPAHVWKSNTTTFCDPCMAGGQFVAAIEAKLRSYGHSNKNIAKRVFGVEKNEVYLNYAIRKYNLTGTYKCDKNDIPEIFNTMKFDVIAGNPPYQTSNAGEKKTHPLWDKFVKHSFQVCKPGGHVCLIHPSGWRNVDGRFSDTKELLLSKQMVYLEIHDEKDGMKTFGASTRYDWYVVKNADRINGISNETTVKFQGETSAVNYDLKKFPFIPNGQIDLLKNIIAKPGEERVGVMYSRSEYGTDKNNMSKEKTDEFIYPCLYMINQGDNATYYYSSEKKGMFGVPKFIWSNGYIPSFGCIVDEKGECGMCQFCYGIIDEPEVLPLIKKAFDSKKFRQLMMDTKMSENSVNRKVIALFRKDFYKEFI